MKLIIQIPCYNEEEILSSTLAGLPRTVDGFDTVEWLIVDDGSVDDTVEVARQQEVEHIVRHPQNKGLAAALMTGLDACLERGADVIVNTDADNQYDGADIPRITAPILEGVAEIVVGARPIESIQHFSWSKKVLQKLGSWAVRIASGTEIPDAPSGFRAISRNAALQLVVFNPYTYTLETIIQAGRRNIPIASVPLRVNEDLRPSRLVSNTLSYVRGSLVTIVRMFVVYKPFRFFGLIGFVLFGAGFLLGLRFLYFFFLGQGEDHVQSVILSGVLLGIGFQTNLVAFLADLWGVNRRLMEEVRYQVKVGRNVDIRTGEDNWNDKATEEGG